MLDKKLTPIEEKVMMVIWDSDEKPHLSEIVKEINERYSKDWKPQTISTYLAHLVRKGYLSFERKGKVFLYTPLVDKKTFCKQQIKNMYEYYGNYSFVDFFRIFQDTGLVTDKDVAEMKNMLGNVQKHLDF